MNPHRHDYGWSLSSYITSPSLQTSMARPSILEISMRACGGVRPSMSLHPFPSCPGNTHITTPALRLTLSEYVWQFGHRGGSPPGPGLILDHFGTSSTAGSCPITDAACPTTRAASSWHGHTSFPLASLISRGSAAPRFWIAFSAAVVFLSDPPRARPVCPATARRSAASSLRTISWASNRAFRAAVFPGVRAAETPDRPMLGSMSWSTTSHPIVGSPPPARSVVISGSPNTPS